MTLSEKVFYEPLTFEEFGLVRTIADQAAAALLNLRLAEQIRHAKELEAFQSMSAFFMHDLKNLVSREFINAHLFRPFQTTKKKGMGIGLFHCKTIVEAHRGKIEVESEEGKGTTFRVFLPIK